MSTTTQRRKARNPARSHPRALAAVETIPTPRHVLVSNGDDWEGFYVDGVLMAENHRLDANAILRALDIDLAKRWVSAEYLGDTVSNLPEKLADIPTDAFRD